MNNTGSSLTNHFSYTEQHFHQLMRHDSSHALTGADVNWNEFQKLARFHRVEGVVVSNLKTGDSTQQRFVPAVVTETISKSAKTLGSQSLRRMKATAEIAHALKNANIDFLLMKGEAISLRYYKSAASRFSKDIDFLVAPADFQRAAEELTKINYHQTKPGFPITEDCLEAIQSFAADATFVDQDTGINIELHWRLFGNPALFDQPISKLLLSHDTIKLAGQSIPVMENSVQLVYLLTHGAVHSWFRLKWLVDINRMLEMMSASEVEKARHIAHSWGLNRPFEEGLILHGVFFQPEKAESLDADLAQVSQYVKRIKQCRSADVRTLADLPNFLSELANAMSLKQGWKYKAWEIALYFIKIDDVRRFGLGKGWVPLYVVSGALGRLATAVKGLFLPKAA